MIPSRGPGEKEALYYIIKGHLEPFHTACCALGKSEDGPQGVIAMQANQLVISVHLSNEILR